MELASSALCVLCLCHMNYCSVPVQFAVEIVFAAIGCFVVQHNRHKKVVS